MLVVFPYDNKSKGLIKIIPYELAKILTGIQMTNELIEANADWKFWVNIGIYNGKTFTVANVFNGETEITNSSSFYVYAR